MSVSTQRVIGILKRAGFPPVKREQDIDGIGHIAATGFIAWKSGDNSSRFIAVQHLFVWTELCEMQEWEHHRAQRHALDAYRRALETAGLTCSNNGERIRIELEES